MDKQAFAAMIDDNFQNDPNPHKYPIIWTTKFYKWVGKYMRHVNEPNQINRIPEAAFYIKNLIEYFYQYGILKSEIKHPKLYRGLSDCFNLRPTFSDNCFIATSAKEQVALDFAKATGNVIKFKTKNLPDNVPIVYISKAIVPHSSEKEYLLLPGTIKINSKLSARYTVNQELVDMYRACQVQSGGARIKKAAAQDILKDLQIDLRNKLVVRYTAVYNRPVEIQSIVKMPETFKKINKHWNDYFEEPEDRFGYFTGSLPDCQDLEKELATETNPDARFEIFRKILSYSNFAAVVERKTIGILSLHFLMPRGLFRAFFYDLKRIGQVQEVIKKELGGNPIYSLPPRRGSEAPPLRGAASRKL